MGSVERARIITPVLETLHTPLYEPADFGEQLTYFA